MSRKIGLSVENNFIKGLITESTGLKFPENAATETFDCIFDPKGTVSRRLGFAPEEGFAVETVDVTGDVINCFVWKNVAEEGDLTFVVVQEGDTLRFYRVSGDNALSAGLHADTIDLTTFIPSSSSLTTVQTYECQYSSGNGDLFVTNPKLDSFFVSYDVALDAISATQIDIETRDFEGDPADTLAIDERPVVGIGGMTAAHRYNLMNQGWTTTNLTDWDTARTDMPSNADVSWYFKNASDEFDFTTVDDRSIGNSKAPRGHFIYNLYNVDRSSNFSGATDFEIEQDRVSTSAFFAGRVWYAGLKAQGFNSKIYFTQIIEGEDQYGKCYQVNDPTSEKLFDLLPSDGGFIDLLEAGNILKMIPYLNTLIVFCTNGVWAITGSQGAGFTANDYSVVKLSTTANISYASFVLAEDKIFWWTHTGIYTVTKDPQSNALAVQNITESTIKDFFYTIPLESRENARGCYDSLNNKVLWLYKSTASNSFTGKYEYDRVLNLNTISGAFYPWTIPLTDDTPHVLSIVSVTGAGGNEVANQVVNGADTVVNGADNVVVFQSENSSIDSVVKYLYTFGGDITWAEERSDSYIDWDGTVVETNYDSYFITGYKLRGEGLRKFQTNYLRLYSNNENPSTFSVRAVWDYALDGARGRISESQQVGQIITMSDPTSYGIKTRRIKIRGHGLVCQLLFNSAEGEPFDIIGWTSLDSANATL